MRVFRLVASAAAVTCLVATAPAAWGQGAAAGGVDFDSGLKVASRRDGGAWSVAGASFATTGTAGQADSGKALDGIGITHNIAKVEYQVYFSGKWTPWTTRERLGEPKQPIEAFRARTDRGSIRYRPTFVDGTVGTWLADGAQAGAPGKSPLESLAVEYRAVSRPGYTFEYRANFRKSGWSAWLKGGAKAEAKPNDPDDDLIAYEVRGGEGIRYEAASSRRGWGPTFQNGQTAGVADSKGTERIDAIRLFGDKNPLRYRVRTDRGGWGAWTDDGLDCGDIGRGSRIVGIQIGPNFASD